MGAQVPGAVVELHLVGAGGEPVDLWRTLASHGCAWLPPNRIDEQTRTLELTLLLDGHRPRAVRIGTGPAGRALVEILGPAPSGAEQALVVAGVRRVLALDEDLSGFYALIESDPGLAWATRGAGRLLRSPTVFEDVVKTLCTTNCTWSATLRMVGALVEGLGEPAAGGLGRAFPTPARMARADEDFYCDVVRAGYRARYLRQLASAVAEGEVDLEALRADARARLSDEEAARRLLALPGIGPYAAAHALMLLGRYSRLVLDSWTRPKYVRLTGRRAVRDSTIERHFRRYRPYSGLAFWLTLTRDWVVEQEPAR